MQECTKSRLNKLMPNKSVFSICFTTYLPLESGYRENDWKNNIKRVDLHKKLVSIELAENESEILRKDQKKEKVGRGNKSGSRILLENFLTNLDIENYQAIGKTLYSKGHLNEASVSKFLIDASELIDGTKLSEIEAQKIIDGWVG